MAAVEDSPPRSPAAPRSSRRLLLLRLALVAGIGLVIALVYSLGLSEYVSWDFLRGHLAALQEFVAERLVVSAIVYFLLYVAVTALSLPFASVLSLTAGALFGRLLGTPLVAVAATVGASAAFLSSRFLFRDVVQARFNTTLAYVNRGIERDGPYYLFTLRLVPIFPYFLVNLVMGLTSIPLWTFAWITLLGVLPASFIYINAGSELGKLESPYGILTPPVLVSLALLGVFPLAVRLLVRLLGKRRLEAEA